MLKKTKKPSVSKKSKVSHQKIFIIAGLSFLFLLILSMVIFFFIPITQKTPKCFLNITDVQKVGEACDALKIDMDNTDLLKPVYDNYYKKTAPTPFKVRSRKIMEFFKLKKRLLWTESDFPLLLSAAIKAQDESKLPKGDLVGKLKLAPNSKIIVFGDLQGAFPSFSRDIIELKKIDVIDENLKLKNKADVIIIMGDSVSRSPFQLELLSLILRLYLQNPEQFFYIKGHHESESYWQEFNLKSELNIRLSKLFPPAEEGKNPFIENVESFFQRLPNGMYLELPGEVEEGEGVGFIRISHYGSEKTNLFGKEIEKKLKVFLDKKIEGKSFDFCGLNDLKDEKSEKDLLLKAVIKSEKKRENYQDMDGLRLLSPEDGVTAWTIMSCPTEIFQKGLKFFFDSFVLISLASKLKETQIEVHKQDIRNKTGFTTRQVNLFSNKEKDVASDNKEENKENKVDKKENKSDDKSKEEDKKVNESKKEPSQDTEKTKNLKTEKVVEKLSVTEEEKQNTKKLNQSSSDQKIPNDKKTIESQSPKQKSFWQS